MSKHSISYNLNQSKYSLKFIIYLFILFDILLFFNISFELFGQVLGWEASIFIGLAIGLKAQGRYRDMVYDMIALRKDPKYKDKEDLRGHRMIRLIDRMMIDYDLYLEKQNKKYMRNKEKTFPRNSNIGKIKFKREIRNFGGEEMKAEMIKDLWYLLASIWAASGLLLIDGLWLLNLRPLWILGIGIAYYAGDALFWLYLYHYQGIKKEDVPPGPVII